MIHLTRELAGKIIEHCERELPNEACGILAGNRGEVKKIYEMTNTGKSPIRFFMDAQEQFKVMKDMRNSNLEMIGIYHSHVASRAYPSAHDIEMAFYPDVSYVIVSLSDKDKPEIKSFRIAEGTITEEEIKIE